MQESPKLDRSRLYEMSHKQIEAVPHDRHRNSRAQPPSAVPARKKHDGNIDERLERMKKPELWNDPGGRGESCNKKRGSKRNPKPYP